MRHALPAPPSLDGEKDFGQLLNEHGLLLRREHQIAVPMIGRREGGEDSSPHSEVGATHVSAFFRPFKAEGNAAKIVSSHERLGKILAQPRERMERTQVAHISRGPYLPAVGKCGAFAVRYRTQSALLPSAISD